MKLRHRQRRGNVEFLKSPWHLSGINRTRLSWIQTRRRIILDPRVLVVGSSSTRINLSATGVPGRRGKTATCKGEKGSRTTVNDLWNVIVKRTGSPSTPEIPRLSQSRHETHRNGRDTLARKDRADTLYWTGNARGSSNARHKVLSIADLKKSADGRASLWEARTRRKVRTGKSSSPS